MSSTVALVDIVDISWRILQGTEEKPLTPRGRSRIRGHRRTKGVHAKLKKQCGKFKHEGRRVLALARVTEHDIDEAYRDEERYTDALLRRRSRAARRQREAVLAQFEERAVLDEFEHELREQSQRALVILHAPEAFERRVEELVKDPEIGRHDLAVAIEQIELVANAICAA